MRTATRERANRYPGPCCYCREMVPAGKGLLRADRSSGKWAVRHLPAEWHGSPVSGRYINGCPGEADKLNGRGA